MPRNVSPRKTANAVASRVARTANTVNIRATNVHSHALPFSSLVAVSSMFNCSCVGSSAANCLIRRPQGRRHLVLYFHRQRRATRLPQQRAEELGRPPLALTIEGHQQGGEGHQPRPRLALRHADGQFRTRRFATAGACQPMQLVLRHVRLDLGQFPHLMPQRFRVAARELLAATPTFGRPQRLHVVALVGGNQGPLVFLVAGLPATFLLRLAFRRLRPGVWMLRAGRQRGILRGQSHYALRVSRSAPAATPRRREPPESSRLRVPAES